MNLKRIKILDRLQYDGGTGHIDLYADFYDENTFVFTKYPSELSSFFDSKLTSKNIDTLLKLTSRNGKKYLSRNIPLPRKDDGTWYKSSKEYERYTRTYSNHLFVNKTIIQPVFILKELAAASRISKKQ
jgi:agmatine/peptidylarginine deiminase